MGVKANKTLSGISRRDADEPKEYKAMFALSGIRSRRREINITVRASSEAEARTLARKQLRSQEGPSSSEFKLQDLRGK